MDVETTIWGTIGALGVFILLGVFLFVRSLWPDRAARVVDPHARRKSFAEGVNDYTGPVGPKLALLTPVKRVLLEFVGAFCGVPGFGWLVSGRVAIGLPLLCAGPAIIYGLYPVYLATTGHLSDRPLIAIEYLPVLAVVSAFTLAVAEFRYAKGASRES